MKNVIIISTLLVLALSGCRRQEAVPMKLGMEVPASSVSSK